MQTGHPSKTRSFITYLRFQKIIEASNLSTIFPAKIPIESQDVPPHFAPLGVSWTGRLTVDFSGSMIYFAGPKGKGLLILVLDDMGLQTMLSKFQAINKYSSKKIRCVHMRLSQIWIHMRRGLNSNAVGGWSVILPLIRNPYNGFIYTHTYYWVDDDCKFGAQNPISSWGRPDASIRWRPIRCGFTVGVFMGRLDFEEGDWVYMYIHICIHVVRYSKIDISSVFWGCFISSKEPTDIGDRGDKIILAYLETTRFRPSHWRGRKIVARMLRDFQDFVV